MCALSKSHSDILPMHLLLWVRMKRLLINSLLVLFFSVCTLVLALKYIVVPHAEEYKPELEAAISRMLGRQLVLGNMQVSWWGLEPWLVLSDIELKGDSGETALSLPSVSASLSWASLATLEPRLSHLVVEEAELDIRRDEKGVVWVAGLPVTAQGEGDSAALAWLLKQGDIQVRNSRLVWLDDMRKAPELVVNQLQLRTKNLLNFHQAAVSATLAGHETSPLELQLEFHTPLFTSRPADLTQWRGEVYAHVHGVELRELRQWVDTPNWLPEARGDVRLWASFEKMALQGVTLDAELSSVTLAGERLKESLVLSNWSGRIDWKKDHLGGTRTTLNNFKVDLPDQRSIGPLNAQLQLDAQEDGSIAAGQVKISSLDVRNLVAVAVHLPFPEAWVSTFLQAQPEGLITRLQWDWHGPPDAPETFRIATAFEGLGMSPLKVGPDWRFPGFKGLSGEFSGDEVGGRWNLTAKEGHVHAPEVLQTALIPFSELSTQGRWRQLGSGSKAIMKLDFDSLQVRRSDMHLSMNGSLQTQGDLLPEVDLSGNFRRVPIDVIPGLMPGFFSPDAISWLTTGLRGGVVTEGSWRLKGKLDDYPFKKRNQGEFSLVGKVQNGDVLFDPEWPAVTNIEAVVSFDNDTLTVSAKQGRTKDTNLSNVQVKIPSLMADAWVLSVEGLAQGAMSDMVKYVNASPVSAMLDGLLLETKANGSAKLALNLELPLSAPQQTKLKGTLNFLENDVVLMSGLPQLLKVKGSLDFNESGVSIKSLSGFGLGGPVKLEGATRPDGSMQFRAEGTASAQGIKRYLSLPTALRISGQTRYGVNIGIKPGVGEPDITVESNLQGLVSDLPAPFVKQAQEVWPFEFRMIPTLSKAGSIVRDELRVYLSSNQGSIAQAGLLQGRLERDRANGKSNILRGAIAVKEPLVMPESGFNLNVKVPKLDLDQWQLTQLGDPSAADSNTAGTLTEGSKDTVTLMPDRITLKTDQLVFATKVINDLVLSANRKKDGWNFDISSAEALGQASWTQNAKTDAAGTLSLKLARLIIPETPDTVVTVAPDPTDYFDTPALDIAVDQFSIGKTNYGKLRLKAVNEGEGQFKQWILRDMQLSNPDATLSAKGEWRREQLGQPRRTRLDFKMDVGNAGKLLDRVGLEKLVRSGSGTVNGRLQWVGPPQSFDYGTMNGELSMDIKNGQFLKAEPGVARLLGILSLQSLPRRLTLDFRDVFSEGFAFDQIFANASVANGVLSTSDFKMRGVSASVLMEGKVDLVKETQDLRAVILPEVNAAGGSLVYSVMAANPAIGIASFLAQLVLKDPLSKAFSFEYKVSGTWVDPSIEKVEKRN